ncbi:hypothetical protein [Desulfurivibrio alkaliphilus]|uniref:Tetratricopeptide TPR_2 repeat protein n=1 Tax=Desulfurivibrio alkaliphilus (strain DSM 19089 / UNIQEM U267 / AHT2) TaxID=589865 RepID=D6Z6G8_DESAT|nr:hypothetical protein [Desulfurivibrio alkaliphilus]ADH86933.1 Tetratricopeptide TPR_2 repeat protein [Desulfurivibrio alkaliphilus AHT 2]
MQPKHWLGSLAIATLLVVPQLVWSEPGAAFYNLEVGKDVLENVTLPTIDGGEATLLDHEMGANVFVFFRPGPEPSRRGLADMARCGEDLADYPVRWTALVSDRYPAEEVQAVVDNANFRGPVLVDQGNTLYGRYGVRLHPVVGVTDGEGRLTAYQPYTQINFCARVKAKVLHTLGEIDDEELQQRLSPRSVDPRADSAVAQRNLRMGQRFLQMGNYEQALATARRSLELDPDLAAAHGMAALSLAHQDQCDEAAAHIDRALALEPAQAEAEAAREQCGQ